MLLNFPDSDPILDYGYRENRPIDPLFHSHVQYEIYYFHEGRCTYLIGDQIYTLAPGDLILMNGMTLHCAKVDPAYEYVRSIIHFEPSVLRPYVELPQAVNVLKPFQELRNIRISLQGSAREEFEQQLLRLDDLRARRTPASRSRTMLGFVDLLYFIYDQCQQPLEDHNRLSSDKEKTVQAIVTLLEASYTEDLHMDQLEREIHLSKSYLSKLFKEVTGVTIFDYVYRKRINEARILFLMEPDVSVTEACYKLGFKHLAHFSRLFKKQVGMTPEAYRKRARGRDAD